MKSRVLSMFLVCVGLMSVTSSAKASDGGFGKLRPFTTDGCSDFPDGTPEEPKLWLHCCVQHDLHYWAGGTRDERLQADLELRACVAATGYPEIAEAMFVGVRVGGTPKLPTSFRWGYGWPRLRGYAPLSPEEFREVRELAPQDQSAVPVTAPTAVTSFASAEDPLP